MLWHRDRMFDLVFDAARGTLRVPVVLPEVPAGSDMYRDFRQFIASRQSDDLPEHRRIDPTKASLKTGNARGNASITLTVLDGDFAYATRAIIDVVHEVYLGFLYDGRYYDYLVETFDLDPDHVS